MKVKDILSLAIKFVDRKELFKDELFLDEVPELYIPDGLRRGEIEEFLFCFNLVYNEIATEYFPLLHTEKVEFVGGKLNFDTLEKVFLSVHALQTENGKKLRFKMFPDHISANAKSAKLTYSFQPDNLEMGDDLEPFIARIPARVLAYGVAMEVMFLKSQSTEALIWENRYKNALLELGRKKTEVVLPARRWI